ncbi:amidohydrolase family protein [Microbacterium sp. NEAU-LLC]|uniref:Amidohydrolase family protein n=1 Tax=Microbacterium helvum TaxID=2773713 RepID=A0ABR8NPV5_9MICO|nr:amidohydrolase family protein [Microbacterium helvum]MBD3942680.1 amidohydrolase family protein [Microbacterium helvum]
MSSTPVRTALVGGLVADGSGDDPRAADVLLADGRVEAIVPAGERPRAGYDARIVDCAGRVVAPGFVDIHCHSDLSRFAYPGNASRVTQGVTTEVVGNCGMSPAPGNSDRAGLARIISTIDVTPDFEWTWSDLDGWLRALDDAQAATNVAAQVGHGSARFTVAGGAARRLDDDELDALENELHAALHAGCLGVSVGLMYAPGEAATARELELVGRVVASHDAVLSAHLRNYGTRALGTAVDELAAPAAKAGARLQISHLRGVGDADGYADVVAQLDDLRAAGVDVAADAYPYVHGHTTLLQLLPSALRAAGPDAAVDATKADLPAVARQLAATGYAPEQLIVMKASRTPEAVGPVAERFDGDPWLWLAGLIVANDGLVDVAVESGRWADVDLAYRTPWISVASDGTALDENHTASAAHPRSWGAFSAGYRRMRDLGASVGEAVRRMSTAPAARVGLVSGIAPGLRADVVVFDDVRFDSAATFDRPATPSSGIDHVFVNGVAVMESGRQTPHRPGVLLRKGSNE